MWQRLSMIADLVLRGVCGGWADDAVRVEGTRYRVALQHTLPNGQSVAAHIFWSAPAGWAPTTGAITVSDCGDSVLYQRGAGGWDDAMLPALRACAGAYGFQLDEASGGVSTTVLIRDLRSAVIRLCQVRAAAAVALPLAAEHLARERELLGEIKARCQPGVP